MEEAEELSTRIGVLARTQTGGAFRCFGTANEIKKEFGKGYEVILTTKPVNPAAIS